MRALNSRIATLTNQKRLAESKNDELKTELKAKDEEMVKYKAESKDMENKVTMLEDKLATSSRQVHSTNHHHHPHTARTTDNRRTPRPIEKRTIPPHRRHFATTILPPQPACQPARLTACQPVIMSAQQP